MNKLGKLGFTLIELLVVISIIAILTIISVSQFNTAKIKARDTQRKADMDSVSKALNSYYADYGEFPIQDEIDWGHEFVDDNPGAEPYYYMRVLPSDPNTQYCYLVNDDPPEYVLFAQMEGVGATTGSYSVTSGPCESSYNFAKSGPNTTITSFCGASDECD